MAKYRRKNQPHRVLLEVCVYKIREKIGDIVSKQRYSTNNDKRDKHDDQGVFNESLPFFIQDVIHHRPASSSLEFRLAVLFQRVGDVGKRIFDSVAQQCDSRDHDDRNKRDDEAVFNHTLTFFIQKETFHVIQPLPFLLISPVCLLQRVGDVGEGILHTVTEQRDGCDDDDRDERDDEAVFHHALAFFIHEKLFH
jgi:hypothetical protein